jgi:hypothetical protein
MERLHPVTGKHEVAVDVKVASLIAIDLNTEGVHDVLLVQVLGNPAKSGIAEVGRVLTLATDVIDVAAGALIRSNHGIVAVNGGGHAGPSAARIVAALDQRLTAGQSIVHRLALTLAENGLLATLTASHGTVVSVLGVRVAQTVTNENTLEVDVAVLVLQNLRSEDWDVVSGIGLASNVEVLLSILGEVVEEESEKSIDVLAGGDSVANAVAAVRVADVDGLVNEDDGGVVVPCRWVVDDFNLLVDAGRS